MPIKGRASMLLLMLSAAACSSTRELARDSGSSWYPEQVVSAEERRHEIAEKEARLRRLMTGRALGGILLSSPENFAWITAGGSDRLVPGGDAGAEVFIRADGQKLILAAGRETLALAGEMAPLGFDFKAVSWFDAGRPRADRETLLRTLTGRGPCGSDSSGNDALALQEPVALLRAPLTESEVKKYRWLGRRCAEAVEGVCRRIEPWITDRSIEAWLAQALLSRAIRPLELRVSVDGAVPGAAARKVVKHAVIGVSASRWGLVVSMNRTVHLGPLPAERQKRFEAVARIHAGFWARTLPGATGGGIMEGAISDCRDAGLTEAWLKGPLGGGAGYRQWEWLALPGSHRALQETEACAWLTAIDDSVLEDTVLLAGDRFEVLTQTRDWPVIEARALGRIYRLPAILVR